MIPALVLRYLPYAAGLTFIVGGLAWIHHHGYKAGQRERTAYYQPILDDIRAQADAAIARNKAIEKASAATSIESENRLHEARQALEAARASANGRITRLVSDLARCGTDRVPETARTSASPEPAAEVAERIAGIGASLAGIAHGCADDAAVILEFQHWYHQQRSILGP